MVDTRRGDFKGIARGVFMGMGISLMANRLLDYSNVHLSIQL